MIDKLAKRILEILDQTNILSKESIDEQTKCNKLSEKIREAETFDMVRQELDEVRLTQVMSVLKATQVDQKAKVINELFSLLIILDSEKEEINKFEPDTLKLLQYNMDMFKDVFTVVRNKAEIISQEFNKMVSDKIKFNTDEEYNMFFNGIKNQK